MNVNNLFNNLVEKFQVFELARLVIRTVLIGRFGLVIALSLFGFSHCEDTFSTRSPVGRPCGLLEARRKQLAKSGFSPRRSRGARLAQVGGWFGLGLELGGLGLVELELFLGLARYF